MADPYDAISDPADPYAAFSDPADGRVLGRSRNGGVTISAAPSRASVATAPRTLPQEIAGGLATLNRSIPFVDEANDALVAAGKTAMDVAGGRTPIAAALSTLKQNYDAGQARTRSLAQDFEARRPLAADLVKGTGLALQAAPAMLSAGATAAPQAMAAAPPARGLMAATARFLRPAAESAVGAGLYAQAAGLGGDGSLQQRLDAANGATLPAMAIGAAIPPALSVAGKARQAAASAIGKTGEIATRVANKVSGGAILDPEASAMSRLAAALRQDGLTPSDIHAGLDAWRESGASAPALMDLAGENTRALLRSVATEPGPARNLAVNYAKGVEGGLQENVLNRTGDLTPGDARTLPEIEGGIGRQIADASAVETPGAGTGGAAVHDALNRSYDTAKAGVDQAYAAARGADPQAAHLPAGELPQVAANLREAVRDFHPDDIPSVARELDGMDKLSTPTVRDLYEMRQRLSGVRQAKPDQAIAAARAIGAIDSSLGDLVDRGAITGDPGVVDLWKTAIGARRDFGRQYEGNDLIQQLTGRGLHGEGRTNLVAPEDASNLILGRSAVFQRPNLARDLSRLRDTLGADSPAWQALQQEAVGRVAGKDAGSERFGQAWTDFTRRNPQLASLLSTPAQRTAISAGQTQVAGALADRAALATGRSVVSAAPDRMAADAAKLGERAPLAQVGAVRELQDQVGRPAAGATGLLNRLSTGPNTGRNLDSLFGPEEAARYRNAIERELRRVENARFVNPNSGPKTANVILDALVNPPADIPVTKLGVVRAILGKIMRGASLTDAEREALVRLGTTRVRASADVPSIPLVGGGSRNLSPAQRARFARLLSAGAGAASAEAQPAR